MSIESPPEFFHWGDVKSTFNESMSASSVRIMGITLMLKTESSERTSGGEGDTPETKADWCLMDTAKAICSCGK